MNWKNKHDIILNWIDSCQTLPQLQNLITFVKSQSFDTDDLLLMIRVKAMSVYAGLLVNNVEQQIEILKR